RNPDDPLQIDAPYWAVSHEPLKAHPGLSNELKRDHGAALAAVALDHACKTANLDPQAMDGTRVGLVLGSALAGQLGMIGFADEVRAQTARFVSPIHFPQTVGNFIAGALARAYNIRGPNQTLACGAASGLTALAEAASLIAAGAADVVFAGGVDALSPPYATGLANHAEVLSEGACILLLESQTSAQNRQVTPLALLDADQDASECQSPAPPNKPTIVSVAGLKLDQAITIQSWIGNAFAALGAAAAAAAIGAAQGQPVPTSGHPALPPNDSTLDLKILVAADDQHTAQLGLKAMAGPVRPDG
ncbi:MAG: beta-ketoacyl synthase N-terminal-like domain-containing protein, partial [Phycisphaerae bacterium]